MKRSLFPTFIQPAKKGSVGQRRAVFTARKRKPNSPEKSSQKEATILEAKPADAMAIDEYDAFGNPLVQGKVVSNDDGNNQPARTVTAATKRASPHNQPIASVAIPIQEPAFPIQEPAIPDIHTATQFIPVAPNVSLGINRHQFPPGVLDEDAVDLPTIINRFKLYAAMTEYIKSGAKIEQCRLDRIIDKDLTILSNTEKHSASNTVIVFGQLHIPLQFKINRSHSEVAIKLSFDPLDPSVDNSLAIERQVYRDVTNKLLFDHHTPHCMLYITEFHCPDFQSDVDGRPPYAAKLEPLKATIQQTRVYDLNNARLLILEKGRGTSLKELLDDNKNDLTFVEYHLKPILFQVLWTLLCFKRVGLQHNDLHLGNIWVDGEQFTTKSESRYYRLDDTTVFRVESPFTAKIYDFDRATKSATPNNSLELNNTLLDAYGHRGHCIASGQCNGFRDFFDAYNVFWQLRHSKSVSSEFKSWITRLGLTPLLEPANAHGGQPCRKPQFKGNACVPVTFDERLLEVIVRTAFDELKIETIPANVRDYVVWVMPQNYSEDPTIRTTPLNAILKPGPVLNQNGGKRGSSYLSTESGSTSESTQYVTREVSMDEAAAQGDIALLKKLHNNPDANTATVAACDGAAANGHLEVLKWWHKNRFERCTTKAMDNAAASGHLEVVQWLHVNRTEGCTKDAMDDAARNGHLAVVQWLHANRKEGCAQAIKMARIFNHGAISDWFRKNNVTCDA